MKNKHCKIEFDTQTIGYTNSLVKAMKYALLWKYNNIHQFETTHTSTTSGFTFTIVASSKDRELLNISELKIAHLKNLKKRMSHTIINENPQLNGSDNE